MYVPSQSVFIIYIRCQVAYFPHLPQLLAPGSYLVSPLQILACNWRCFTVNWTTLHTTRLADMAPATPSRGAYSWACVASVNWIGCAHYLNRGYCYGAHDMNYHNLLRPCQNYYTYNSVVKNTYSPCHKDACVSKFQLGILNDCCVTKA